MCLIAHSVAKPATKVNVPAQPMAGLPGPLLKSEMEGVGREEGDDFCRSNSVDFPMPFEVLEGGEGTLAYLAVAPAHLARLLL